MRTRELARYYNILMYSKNQCTQLKLGNPLKQLNIRNIAKKFKKIHSRSHHAPNEQSGQTCNLKDKQRMQHDSKRNNHWEIIGRIFQKNNDCCILFF